MAGARAAPDAGLLTCFMHRIPYDGCTVSNLDEDILQHCVSGHLLVRPANIGLICIQDLIVSIK